MESSSTDVRARILTVLVLLLAAAAAAKDYAPYPAPGAGYVTDAAGVLTTAQEERIEHWLLAVEKQSGTEIVVVTIASMHDYPGTDDESIESFARGLFDRWGIGNMPHNDGILLLVAVRDRKARIELGAGYPARDADAARIMQSVIVPRFRKGDYAGGITRGVAAIVNKFTTVHIGFPWALVLIPAAGLACALIAISLLRNGRRGWGWVFVGLTLILILVAAFLAVAFFRMRSSSSGWASGGAGGFGSGFSGGGGATGSW